MDTPCNVMGHDTMSSAMKDAKNYYNYIMHLLTPHIKDVDDYNKNILEIGPGYGQYTYGILKYSSSLYVADIDPKCIAHLKESIPQVHGIVSDLSSMNWIDSFGDTRFSVAIALNVIEHIQNDKLALKNIYDVLSSNAKLLLIVPAHMKLYGTMDKLAGHYRRYELSSLREMLTRVGFVIDEISYINPIGGLGWYLNAKFYNPNSLSTDTVNSQIILFDKYILPISRFLTPLTRMFFGQSLWAVAHKE